MPSGSVQGKMARGALWMLLLTIADNTLGFVSTLILVRLLSPADFGLVAMAWSFIILAQLLAAFGFDVALIHKKDPTAAHYHTAWTLNVMLGLLILLLLLAVAGPIASFYNQPGLFWVVCVLSLGPLIGGCENIGVVVFRKDLDFHKEFTFQISRRLIGFVVTVLLAFWLQNYWALVVGSLTLRVAGVVASYLMHPFRPRFSLAQAESLLGFSKWLMLNNIVGFLKERSSDFIIGRLLGVAPLGMYNINYEIASMPTTALSAPVNRALLPGFSRIAHDPEEMHTAYSNAMHMLALFAVPAAAGIYTVAPFLVPVVLGPKWLAGVSLMEILAFNGGLLFFHSSICTVLIANGHPDRVAKTNGLYVVIVLILFGLLVPSYGLIGAALSALGASVLSTPVYLSQVRRSVGVPASVFVRAAAHPVVAALAMVGLVRWVLPAWTPQMNSTESIGWLIGGITLGIFAYGAAVLLLWLAAGCPAGAERVLLEGARQHLLKRHSAPASTPS